MFIYTDIIYLNCRIWTCDWLGTGIRETPGIWRCPLY